MIYIYIYDIYIWYIYMIYVYIRYIIYIYIQYIYNILPVASPFLRPKKLMPWAPRLPSAALLLWAVDRRVRQPAPACNRGTCRQHLGVRDLLDALWHRTSGTRYRMHQYLQYLLGQIGYVWKGCDENILTWIPTMQRERRLSDVRNVMYRLRRTSDRIWYACLTKNRLSPQTKHQNQWRFRKAQL